MAKLPKFAVGDIVRDNHGEGGRVVDVRPYPIYGFLVFFRREVGPNAGNGTIVTSQDLLALVERKMFPDCVTVTCPECAAVWPIPRQPETPLEQAAAAYVFGVPGAREKLIEAAKEASRG